MHNMKNDGHPPGGHEPPSQETTITENPASRPSTETPVQATPMNRPCAGSDGDQADPSGETITAVNKESLPNATEELEDHQLVDPASNRPKEKQRSNGKAPTSVRDLKYSDIKPWVEKKRQEGKKPSGTRMHRYLVRKYGPQLKPQLRTTQRIILEIKEELDKAAHPATNQDEQSSEVYFPQKHHPGQSAQLDCSSLASLKITINGKPFKGKIFTCKLMYSKAIYAAIVLSEKECEVIPAIENALFAFGGVPLELRSDNGKALFAWAKKPSQAYADLYSHYGASWSSINPGRPHENGGAETGNKTIKNRLRDRLDTDVDPDFASLDELKDLLLEVLEEYNADVVPKLEEERRHLRRLPRQRVEPYEQIERKVRKEGVIKYDGCSYSVPPYLHGSELKVKARLYTDRLVIYDHDGLPVWRWPLATGAEAQVDFRHVIHWLERKPGAFKDCDYGDSMFPTDAFRKVYQKFKEWYAPPDAEKNILAILVLATGPNPIRQGDDELIKEVDCALGLLLEKGERFTYPDVLGLVGTGTGSRLPEAWSNVTQTAFGE